MYEISKSCNRSGIKSSVLTGELVGHCLILHGEHQETAFFWDKSAPTDNLRL